MKRLCEKAVSVFGRVGDDVSPVLDGPLRLPDRVGESILLVEKLPLATLVELEKMPQCPARPEQLSLGVLALDIGGQSFGHGTMCNNSAMQIVRERVKNA